MNGTADTVPVAGLQAKCANKQCGFVGDIDDYFGKRMWKGRTYVQSYCKVCRRAKAKPLPKPEGRDGEVFTRKSMNGPVEYLEEVKPLPPEAPVEILVPSAPSDHPNPFAVLAGKAQKVIPFHKQECQAIYCNEFPLDTNGKKRAFWFMVKKLVKRGYTPDERTQHALDNMKGDAR